MGKVPVRTLFETRAEGNSVSQGAPLGMRHPSALKVRVQTVISREMLDAAARKASKLSDAEKLLRDHKLSPEPVQKLGRQSLCREGRTRPALYGKHLNSCHSDELKEL